MTARKAGAEIFLTQRALRDLVEIEAYSINDWGKRAATKYLADVEAALIRLQQNPGLLLSQQDLHPNLQFYRVNKHLLVCDVRPQTIVVLTVICAGRDLPSRLAEMEPSLPAEVELLHQKLHRRKKPS